LGGLWNRFRPRGTLDHLADHLFAFESVEALIDVFRVEGMLELAIDARASRRGTANRSSCRRIPVGP
jgi:hypothetical protein